MLRQFGKAVLVAEVAAVGSAYYVFHGLNTSAEYRKWMGEKAPFVLDGFCQAVTSLGFPLPPDVADRNKRTD